MTAIATYDPNIRWATHTYAFTFQMWDYKLTLEAGIGGNCRGFVTMESALRELADRLYEEQGENPELVLTRPGADGDEDRLECSPDDDDIEDWLMGMCVGITLVRHEAEKPASPMPDETGKE